jgi:hypothetical protein
MESLEQPPRVFPSPRRRLALVGAILALVLIALVFSWPVLVHRLMVAQLRVVTHRPVSIEAVHLNPFTGHLAVRGLRMLDRDGQTPLRISTSWSSACGRSRSLAVISPFEEVVLEGPIVRVVRSADAFNF